MRIAIAMCTLLAGLANANAVTSGDILPGKWLQIVNKTPWEIVSFGLVEPGISPNREITTYDISGGLSPSTEALFDSGLEQTSGCVYFVIVKYHTDKFTMSRQPADICLGSTITLEQ